jgi:hypothetical protein
MNPIEAFWAWWPTARQGVERSIMTGEWGDLPEQLTRRLHEIHPELAWEFNRGQRAQHALCITPEGKPELRALTERWLRAAPATDATWEYHPARPATPDALSATLEIAGRRLDPGQTRLRVEVDEDRQVLDVVFWHPAFRKLTPQVRGTVAFLVLDWLLGEDGVERWVGAVDISARSLTGSVPAEALPEIADGLAERHLQPTWALLQGTDPDGYPVLVMARRPLKRVEYPLFDLHGDVTIQLQEPSGDGLPTPDELGRLRTLEDDLLGALGDTAVMAAHQTSRGQRTFHLYCDSEGTAPARVQAWEKRHSTLKVAVTWEPDGAWNAIAPFR